MDYHDLSIRVQDDGDILASSDQGELYGKLNLDQKALDRDLRFIKEDRTDEELLKKVGAYLYNALFDINLSKHFIATKAGADKSECGVRLRLIFQKPELAAIPWEFLYDGSTNTFLANDPNTALSRYIDVPLRKQDIKPARLPLKMLLLISSPKDLAPLDTAEEERLIKQALKEHIASGQIEMDVLTKATVVEIDQKLNEMPYNIIHFIGHGIFDNNKGRIALMDEDGRARLLDDQAFADLFLGQRGLGLAILNACEGAATSSNQIFAGMAPLLVQRGIPAIIAMQYSIRDSTAKLFADKFYRTLALAKSVDESVQSTRNLISIQVGRNKRDFATPVLYMRAKDGVVLELAKKESVPITESNDADYITKGDALCTLGKYNEAIDSYEEAIKLDPKSKKALNKKGYALHKQKMYYDALIIFDNSIVLDYRNAETWTFKGNSLSGLSRDDEALDCYDRAIRYDPNYRRAWISKGYSFHKLKKYEGAIRCFDEAISLDPMDISAWVRKGDSLAGLGNYNEAIKCYDKAIDRDIKYKDALMSKGYSLLKLKKYDEAIKIYNDAIGFYPKLAAAWYNKAIALRSIGRVVEADAASAKARELGYKG